MFLYKDYITLNNKFNKSTNIIYDTEECNNYIITKSTQDTLKVLFKADYHNSLALIGPFGCGKSSLLLYINTLLSPNDENEHCINELQKYSSSLYEQYEQFVCNKKFFKIKIVGEHTSFKFQFKNTLINFQELKKVNKYLKDNETFQISKALELLNEDLLKSQYTDMLFTIDEFGKFIEYGLEDSNANDIFDLQTLSEFVNKKNNYKLVVSLHKTFCEYSGSDLIEITYTEWDKIQGRFENIVFKDDYYEILNVFKETIAIKQSTYINESIEIVKRICNDTALSKTVFNSEFKDLFERIVPIHPFSAIIISEIFTKYFQNQRSIFSFIFSSEPNGFQEYIEKERYTYGLYSINDLYDYISYLLKVYTILLPDKEIWYISEYRLKDIKIDCVVKKDIIKTIALIHSFKLANTIKPNKEFIVLSLAHKYSSAKIEEVINELLNNDILVFQEQTQSYSFIEDSNININKELNNRLVKDTNINFEKKLNEFIVNKLVVAKRFFIEYGNKKVFEKIYILDNDKLLLQDYKIIFSDKTKDELVKVSLESKKSVYIPIENLTKINDIM
nr:hypothetical protein [Candidatus Gracilibacteria bacterium]